MLALRKIQTNNLNTSGQDDNELSEMLNALETAQVKRQGSTGDRQCMLF